MNEILETLQIQNQKIVLDFCKNNYITINSKQYNKNSRYVPIQLTNNGQPVVLNAGFSVEIKMLTPDNRAILNRIPIQSDGTLLLELTESMLYYPGKAEAEIRVLDNTGSEIRLLSTMNFNILINASPYDDDIIIDSDEFNALIELYEKAEKDYTYVIESAQSSADAAKASATNAENSAKEATTSATNASTSATNAENSEKEALDMANMSKSYAVGTNGEIRDDDSTDNAQYYYELSKRIAQGVTGVVYMGTITFADLSNPDNQQANYMFNISEAFTTDDTFKEGAGQTYGAGVNVCRTADGYWDALVGSTVTGIKGNAEKNYRTGNVNITAKDIGIPNPEVVSESEPTDQETGSFWMKAY